MFLVNFLIISCKSISIYLGLPKFYNTLFKSSDMFTSGYRNLNYYIMLSSDYNISDKLSLASASYLAKSTLQSNNSKIYIYNYFRLFNS